MKKMNCPFLNIPNTTLYASRFMSLHTLDSEYLGRYMMSEFALMQIGTYKSDKKFQSLGTSQALINCAQRILTANERGYFPYLITDDQISQYKDKLEELQKQHEDPIVLINLNEAMKEKVDHTLKSDSLLLRFAEKLEDGHAFSKFKTSIKDMVAAKIAGRHECIAIVEYLIKEKYLEGEMWDATPFLEEEDKTPFNDSLNFTMKGWKQIQIEREKTNTNKVFIATQFMWPKDDNLRAEVMEAIKRACHRLGWQADIVSQGHTDSITDKILSEIRSCKFVVAELTYHNRGVYFESGYARGLGKNVFHMVHKDFTKTNREADAEAKRMHFDIQQVQYRSWETAAEAEEKLYDWINSTIGKYSEV